MDKKKSTPKAAPMQAPPGSMPTRPLSPKAVKLYHELLEMIVAATFGGGLGSLRYLQAYARGRSGNLSSGWAIRWETLDKIFISMEEVRRKLYPHNQRGPAKAA